jgi:hypothetical protein
MGRRKNGQYLFYIAFAAIVILYLLQRYRALEGFQDAPIKSVIINLLGGLGNQLFIYAGGLTLKEKHKTELFLLPVSDGKNIHSSKDYRFLFSQATPIEYDDPRMKDARQVSIQTLFFGPWRDIPTDQNTNIFIHDHWFQDFPSIRSVIPQVKQEVVGSLSEMYGDVSMDKASSAFIHVRRGDYTAVASPYVLDMAYYAAALAELNKSEAIKTIYIFSDDMAWCKQQKWETTKQIQFIDEPDELKTLYMMSQCEAGAAIANSTFSSWGAFLGPYMTSAPVIYPSKWLFDGNLSLPTEWIRK